MYLICKYQNGILKEYYYQISERWPGESRIDTANKLKYDKYQPFLTDISVLSPTVIPFEIGAHTSFISSRNKGSLKNYIPIHISRQTWSWKVSATTSLAASQAEQLRGQHHNLCKTDNDGNCYRTVQDEVVEVLAEEQHKSRLSSYFEYINIFVGISNVRRNILL